MRFEVTGKWKNGFSHDGLLYCAQRIEEMLMSYTSHIYKTPVYNTFLLAYEFLQVYDDSVQSGLIDKAHLGNVIEEFLDTFKSDPVIKDHFSDSQIQYFHGKIAGGSVSEKRRIIEYLINILGDYPIWCAESLKKAVEDPKGKKKIDKVLRSYIPMMIGIGYHPYYIYHVCKNIFVKSEIGSIEALKTFMATFDGADNDYIVYFIVDKRIKTFESILSDRLRLSFECDEFSEKLHYDDDRQICVHFSESALDPNVAAQKAYFHFDLFMRYYRFLGNRDREWVGKKCLVKNDKSECAFPHIGSDRYFYSKDFDDTTLGKNSERIIDRLLESARGNDFLRIDKVIRTHNNAISSEDLNNAFLNLWSALEIIGVEGYEGDTSKIKKILNNIIPILTRNYVNRIVEEMHDYLKGNLDEEEYYEIINEISETGNEEYKIACLISLEQYKNTRKKAYSFLNDYPIIRSRISQLYEDVFKKKKMVVIELNRYAQRLEWHIQRLYRVRNSIIHSGDVSENMVSLVEHLHSYVDEVILDLINRMTGKQSLGTVINTLLDAQVYMENLRKDFSCDEGLTPKDVKRLLE